ncbi:hypothetical protein [Pseudobutyrivibrio ruminis]|uniref:Uncharacterized protein n=1 Tax=Pseudobutyrivibrio ruminis DSM 9787 TaxID=1123011 RepID=A0A285SKB2_9FIRM|nr:hypothetical protein [Pseudobutyrivibrio ruminis]SOC08095.1 hypothetical protein SAMN02910411_2412 [Pseudobutyrivibrio ruminis DSM 9787]
MCAYYKKTIVKKMDTYPLENLYQYRCSTTAKTSDKHGSVFYSEVMAEYVLKRANELKRIQRENVWKIEPSPGLSYFSKYRTNIDKARKGDDGKNHLKDDDEKIICRQMYINSKNGLVYDGIGKIIDFETPLAHLREADKDPYRTRKVGNVDLISFSSESKATIWLLEVKKELSDESMYRCVMEGFSYLQTIDRARFIEDLKKHVSWFGSVPKPIVFKTAPLIAYKGKQFEEMNEAKNEPMLHQKLLELMRFLDITVYFSYEIKADSFKIRKHYI